MGLAGDLESVPLDAHVISQRCSSHLREEDPGGLATFSWSTLTVAAEVGSKRGGGGGGDLAPMLAVDVSTLASLAASSQLRALSTSAPPETLEMTADEEGVLGLNIAVKATLAILSGGMSVSHVHSSVLLEALKAILFVSQNDREGCLHDLRLPSLLKALAGRVWELDHAHMKHALHVVMFNLVIPNITSEEVSRHASVVAWTLMYMLRLHGGRQSATSLCWFASCLLRPASSCAPTKQAVSIAHVVLYEALMKGHQRTHAVNKLIAALRGISKPRPRWVDQALLKGEMTPGTLRQRASHGRAFKLVHLERVLLQAARSHTLPTKAFDDLCDMLLAAPVESSSPHPNRSVPYVPTTTLAGVPCECLVAELLTRRFDGSGAASERKGSLVITQQLSDLIDEVERRCLSPEFGITVASVFASAHQLYSYARGSIGSQWFPPTLPFALRTIEEEVCTQLSVEVSKTYSARWARHEMGRTILQPAAIVPDKTLAPPSEEQPKSAETREEITPEQLPTPAFPQPGLPTAPAIGATRRPSISSSAIKVVSSSAIKVVSATQERSIPRRELASKQVQVEDGREGCSGMGGPQGLATLDQRGTTHPTTPQSIKVWQQCRVDSDPLSDLALSGMDRTAPRRGWLAGYRTHRGRFAADATVEEKGRASLLFLAEGALTSLDMSDCGLRNSPPPLPPHPPEHILEARVASTPPQDLLKAESNHNVFVAFHAYSPPSRDGFAHRFPWLASWALKKSPSSSSTSTPPLDRHNLYRAPPAAKATLQLHMLTAAYLRYKGIHRADSSDVIRTVLTCLEALRALTLHPSPSDLHSVTATVREALAGTARLIRWVAVIGEDRLVDGGRRYALPRNAVVGLREEYGWEDGPEGGFTDDPLSATDVIGQMCVNRTWARHLMALMWTTAGCCRALWAALDAAPSCSSKSLQHDFAVVIDSILTPLPQAPQLASRARVMNTGRDGPHRRTTATTQSLLLRRMYVTLGVAPPKELMAWRSLLQAACDTPPTQDVTTSHKMLTSAAESYRGALNLLRELGQVDTDGRMSDQEELLLGDMEAVASTVTAKLLPLPYQGIVPPSEAVAPQWIPAHPSYGLDANRDGTRKTPITQNAKDALSAHLPNTIALQLLPRSAGLYHIYRAFAPNPPMAVRSGMSILHEALLPYLKTNDGNPVALQPSMVPSSHTEEDPVGNRVLHIVGCAPPFPIHTFPEGHPATSIRRWSPIHHCQ